MAGVWNSFESAIPQNDRLSNVDKFSYLRSLLMEPVRSAIGGFALTSANYESADRTVKETLLQEDRYSESTC